MRAGEDRSVAWPALGPRGCQVVWARPVMPDVALLDAGVRERLATLRLEEDRRRHATGAVLADALARIHGGTGARVVRRRGAAPVVEGARVDGRCDEAARMEERHGEDVARAEGARVDGRRGEEGARGESVHVDGSELYVSVAHGGAWVVVAVCAVAAVGVDVEPLGRGLDAVVAGQVLAPAEREVVRTAEELVAVWTRKEAVAKATGDGFGRVDPREVVLAPVDERPRLVAYKGRAELVGATAIADVAPDEEHVGAVAVLAAEPVTLTVLDGGVLLS